MNNCKSKRRLKLIRMLLESILEGKFNNSNDTEITLSDEIKERRGDIQAERSEFNNGYMEIDEIGA